MRKNEFESKSQPFRQLLQHGTNFNLPAIFATGFKDPDENCRHTDCRSPVATCPGQKYCRHTSHRNSQKLYLCKKVENMKASSQTSNHDFKLLPVKTKKLPKNLKPKKIDPNFSWASIAGIAKDDEEFKKAYKEGNFD